MKKIAILNCLKANDVCGAVACLNAFYDRKAAFEVYGDEELRLCGALRCSNCGRDTGEDAGMRKKLERLVSEGVETVHIGICAFDQDSGELCPHMACHKAWLEGQGVSVIHGTHNKL